MTEDKDTGTIGYTCQRCNKPIDEAIGCECVKNGLMPLYPSSSKWSLKGKLLRRTKTETGNPTIGRSLPVMSFYEDTGILMTVGRYYAKCDIDTLREKLIEDILGYVDIEIGHDSSLCSHMSYVIKDIINKRFGVEE